ncbi:hypothetical protein ON010_g2003 [Phytophthora cinnamomi]|nr:hypothetical protein ON010_g2003 [Phytophthora cinnamomi]
MDARYSGAPGISLRVVSFLTARADPVSVMPHTYRAFALQPISRHFCSSKAQQLERNGAHWIGDRAPAARHGGRIRARAAAARPAGEEVRAAEAALRAARALAQPPADGVARGACRVQFAVIDLTSPHAGANAAARSIDSSQGSVARDHRSPQSGFLPRDDICAESPSSSLDSPQLSTRESRASEDQEQKEDAGESWRRYADRMYSTPASRRRLHLDFSLPPGLMESHRSVSSPPRRVQHHRLHSDQSTSSHSSPQSAHSMTTHSGEPRTRTRPRLQLHHHSPERSAARAYGYELEEEVEPRTHRHDRYHWASDPSPERSTPSPVVSAPSVSADPSPIPRTIHSPATRPRAQSDEEASLALARYLQQQENIAAYEEYQARLHRESAEREYNERSLMSNSSLLSDLAGHQRQIDPDNMTYEELLRLGEEVGDVKKERWQRMAVQVLSSLPTHRWTRGQSEDTTISFQMIER